ncbi:glutathione S-transferase family protein [Klebsiella pneumoniae]
MAIFLRHGAISLAPHILLNELNVEYEPIAVKVADNLVRNFATAEFLEINPCGLVPVLHTDEFILTEAVAISLYLIEQFPNSALLPTKRSFDYARVLELLCWLATDAHRVISTYFRPEHVTSDISVTRALRSFARSQFYLLAEHIEARISQDVKNGIDLKLVGIFLLVYFRQFEAVGIDMSRYPMWSAIVKKTRGRTAVLKTMVVEGIDVIG